MSILVFHCLLYVYAGGLFYIQGKITLQERIKEFILWAG